MVDAQDNHLLGIKRLETLADLARGACQGGESCHLIFKGRIHDVLPVDELDYSDTIITHITELRHARRQSVSRSPRGLPQGIKIPIQ
jgi:hypothetical protein